MPEACVLQSNDNLSIHNSQIINQITNLLEIIRKINGKENKIVIINEIFIILDNNRWLLDYAVFRNATKCKLLEFEKDWEYAKKYYEKFFN